MERKFTQLIPLLAFSALTIIAVGIVFAIAAVELFSADHIPWSAHAMWTAFGFALTALALSLLHLGRKRKFFLAVLGLRHSWLSREVLICVLFIVFVVIASLSIQFAVARAWVTVSVGLASVAGLAATLSMGMIYLLEGQIGWQGAKQVFAPVVGSLYLAGSIVFSWAPTPWIAWIFWPLLVLDGALCGKRYYSFHRNVLGETHLMVFPHLRALTSAGYLTRAMLGTILPILLVISWRTAIPVSVIIAIILDRFALYAGSMQHTPKAEIARIKAERMRAAAIPE